MKILTNKVQKFSQSLFILVFMSLVVFGNTDAEGKWWEKGKSLFKNMTETEESGELTLADISGGLKDALRIGTENVVNKIGQKDGFSADSQIRIPLPENLQKVKSVLGKIGMAGMLDDLELKLNQAAEAATPKAKKLFWNAIAEMKLDDVKAIYSGPDNAATLYFRQKMSPELSMAMRPVVESSLSKVGAINTYNAIIEKYNSIPFTTGINMNMEDYAIDKAMDGIFYYLEKEEKAIRQNPAKQTTDLLKQVFGNK